MGSIDANPAALEAFGGGVDGFQPLNADDVRSYLHKSVDFIYDYYKSVESMPVLPGVEPGYLSRLLQSAPPSAAAPFDIAMKELREAVVPGMTHWASPNFFAFFPSTNSAAAIAGDLIASAMNTVGFTWQANPAATEMEVLALDWLAQLLRLPASFMNRTAAGRGTGGGVILGTTSEAMLVTLVAAPDAALRRIESEGVSELPRLAVYAGDQIHSTFFKACRLAGFDPANIRSIPTSPETDYGLDPAARWPGPASASGEQAATTLHCGGWRPLPREAVSPYLRTALVGDPTWQGSSQRPHCMAASADLCTGS